MVKTVLLALLAVAGPLQAQLAYACNVMDSTVHGSCCCDVEDQKPLAAPDRHSPEDPCCETSIELTVAEDPDRSTFSSSRAERPPDSDPLPGIALHPAAPIAEIPVRLSARITTPRVPCRVGTDTYLLTQRLRI